MAAEGERMPRGVVCATQLHATLALFEGGSCGCPDSEFDVAVGNNVVVGGHAGGRGRGGMRESSLRWGF